MQNIDFSNETPLESSEIHQAEISIENLDKFSKVIGRNGLIIFVCFLTFIEISFLLWFVGYLLITDKLEQFELIEGVITSGIFFA